jgi:hypothetical protein
MRLRIESADGSLVNDYRICDGGVHVKSLDPLGQAVSGSLGSWRVLDKGDIELHHALGTAVSQWLCMRLGGPQKTLDQVGIDNATSSDSSLP